MEKLQIRFTVHKSGLYHFNLDILERFGRYHSIFFPIYLEHDQSTLLDDQQTGRAIEIFNIVEASDNIGINPTKLAIIEMKSDSSWTRILVDGVQISLKKWYKVEKFIQAFIEYFWNLGYQISAVYPPGIVKLSLALFTKDTIKGDDALIESIAPQMEPISSGIEKDNKTKKNLIDINDIPRYGTNRNLSRNDVKDIVKECKEYQEDEVSVFKYYYEILGGQADFSFAALNKWIGDPKFLPD